MTRCQEAAFACVLLTVPRPWRGSFVCSARVCEVCAIIWSCMYRDTRVRVCSYEPIAPVAWKPTACARPDLLAHCWAAEALAFFSLPVAAAFCLPVGTERCCRQRAAARESCTFARLRLPGEVREGVLLEKYLRFYSRSSLYLASSFFHFVLLPKLLAFLSEQEKSV